MINPPGEVGPLHVRASAARASLAQPDRVLHDDAVADPAAGMGAVVVTAGRTRSSAWRRRTSPASAIALRVERRINPSRPPVARCPTRRKLQGRLVADLHADSLLWGRDLLVRGDRGSVDIPRLIEGGVALQALAACVRVARNADFDRNADTSDDVTLIALAGGWPVRTWRSLRARALYMAGRARRMAAVSAGRFTLVSSAGELGEYLRRRSADPGVTAGLLTIEGAAPLEGDPGALDGLADAGFRMLGLTHFVDNVFAGSARGLAKAGLTGAGRDLVRRAEARSVLVDVAHTLSRDSGA